MSGFLTRGRRRQSTLQEGVPQRGRRGSVMPGTREGDDEDDDRDTSPGGTRRESTMIDGNDDRAIRAAQASALSECRATVDEAVRQAVNGLLSPLITEEMAELGEDAQKRPSSNKYNKYEGGGGDKAFAGAHGRDARAAKSQRTVDAKPIRAARPAR